MWSPLDDNWQQNLMESLFFCALKQEYLGKKGQNTFSAGGLVFQFKNFPQ